MGEPETGEQRPETGKWNALREREPRKTQRGRDATKRHLKRKDAKTQRSGRIHEERKKAGKDLLAEPLFLPSCFPHSIPHSLWTPKIYAECDAVKGLHCMLFPRLRWEKEVR